MNKLDFIELHKEKLALIFENIDILSAIKESDTIIPFNFFKEVNADVISDYKAKMGILSKNTKFVVKELKKDFKQLRKKQKKSQAKLRKQQAKQ